MTRARGPAFFLLLAGLFVFGLFGEDERVLLIRGPKLGKGLEFFDVNAIPYELGEYRYKDFTFSAYFIRRYVPNFPGWVRKDCEMNRLLVLPDEARDVFIYESEEAWTVLFVFPKNSAAVCPLLDQFLEKLRFFNRLDAGSPLPAVIDIKKR